MRLGGFIKNTALDFPGIISAAVFTQGCNFTCPYCHNPELVRHFGLPVEEAVVWDFLRRRRGLLDGLVISGGEPTLQPDLLDFCRKARGLNYAVKLDTNGSRPEVVTELISRKLIDYVALDIKAAPEDYTKLAPEDFGPALLETAAILKRSPVFYEFRTTVAAPFVTQETIVAIAKIAAGQAPFYLQAYRSKKVLNQEFMNAYTTGQSGPDQLKELRALALPFTPNCLIR